MYIYRFIGKKAFTTVYFSSRCHCSFKTLTTINMSFGMKIYWNEGVLHVIKNNNSILILWLMWYKLHVRLVEKSRHNLR